MWLSALCLAEPLTYSKPLVCLQIHLTAKALSLYVLSVTVGESEMEVTNSNLLISDLLGTADLEASLNPIVLEPGWLESLPSSWTSAPDLDKDWEWANSTNPNFEWRKWGRTQLLYRTATSDAKLVLPKSGGFR